MANSYTDVDDLMNFAATWGIQESAVVCFHLFQLRNPEYTDDYFNEQLSTVLDNLGGPLTADAPLPTDREGELDIAVIYVREQEEVEACSKALLFDDEMESLAEVCVEDGDWDPPSPLQIGRGEEPQPGPSSEETGRVEEPQPGPYHENK